MSAQVDQRTGDDASLARYGPGRGTPARSDPPTGARSDTPSAIALRADFGAHVEANYRRLVAQLYAITLDAAEAHDVVQDAYSRAWRDWAAISRSPDPTAWVRRVAVRATIRSWRRVLARIGVRRPGSVGDGVDDRTGALLGALGRLSAAERRCVVLFHMAGVPLAEIAAVERLPRGTVQARLARARTAVSEVLGAGTGSGDDPYADEGEYR